MLENQKQQNLQKSQTGIRVGVFRGNQLESAHTVVGAVVDSTGNSVMTFGQSDIRIFPRSSIKPIQAIPLIITGAFEKYNVSLDELALACASHSGERIHYEEVNNWLKRLNLKADDLECGFHHPSSLASTIEMVKENIEFTAVCNNCSGKHTGMLCHALQMGDSLKGYTHYNHPVQQRVKQAIEDFCEVQLTEKDFGIDGCSIPSFYIQLNKFALGMAKIADGKLLDEKNKKAVELIFKACVENPLLVAGSERFCTRVMLRTKKEVLIKTGAEGVMAASIKPMGLGIVLKCLDGAPRAAETAMTNLLNKFGYLTSSEDNNLLSPDIYNWNKIKTGFIKLI